MAYLSSNERKERGAMSGVYVSECTQRHLGYILQGSATDSSEICAVVSHSRGGSSVAFSCFHLAVTHVLIYSASPLTCK